MGANSISPVHQAAPGQPGVALTADQELRRQCLVWAFQTREFRDVPHMHVVNVAQDYHDFIKGAARRAALFRGG